MVLSRNERGACNETAAQLRDQGCDAIGPPCDVILIVDGGTLISDGN